MLFREALAQGVKQLKKHRCDGADALLESEALLCFAAGISREKLFTEFDRLLAPRAERKFFALIARRAAHTPLAWLLGTAPFLGREFMVTLDTLIPRAATEMVVEAALAAARAATEAGAPEDSVTEAVDVGSGSGCIAVSLALALPKARVWATDSSIPALAITRRNAKKHGVASMTPKAGHVTIRKTNLLGYDPTPGHASRRPLPLLPTGTVLMVANLPYVPTTMRPKMSKCVLQEPPTALFSGRDGLDASRALVRQLTELHAKLPNKKTILAFEILAKQFVPLAAVLRRAFPGVAAPTRIKNYEDVTIGLMVRLP